MVMVSPITVMSPITNAERMLRSFPSVMAISGTDLSIAIRDASNPANNFVGNVNSKLTNASPFAKVIVGSNGFYQSGTTIRTAYSSTGAALGFWVEGSRRNDITYSRDFTNAIWVGDNSGASNPIVTPNYAISPDGTQNATRIQLNKTGGLFSRLKHAVTGTAASVVTMSLFMKSTTGSTYNVGLRSGASASQNNVITSSWQRVTMTYTLVDTDQAFEILLFDSIAGNDETADILIYQAQSEVGGHASTPIFTSGAAVTRTDDLISLATSLFPFSATEGTIRISAYIDSNVDNASGNYYFSISDGTISNAINGAELTGSLAQIVRSGATEFVSTVNPEPTTGVVNTMCLAYKANDCQAAANGFYDAIDTSVTLPTVNVLKFGARGDSTSAVMQNGIIRDFLYVPTRFPQIELAGASLESYAP